MRDGQQLSMEIPGSGGRGLSRARNVPRGASTTAKRKPQSAPFVAGSATSEAASRNVDRTRLSKKEQVYRFILGRGAFGATRTEIASGTGLSENTVRPRVKELMAESDSAFGTPRVYESQYITRNGRAVLFTGVFARNERERDAAQASYEDAMCDRQVGGGY